MPKFQSLWAKLDMILLNRILFLLLLFILDQWELSFVINGCLFQLYSPHTRYIFLHNNSSAGCTGLERISQLTTYWLRFMTCTYTKVMMSGKTWGGQMWLRANSCVRHWNEYLAWSELKMWPRTNLFVRHWKEWKPSTVHLSAFR